jgi:hypothetical protein
MIAKIDKKHATMIAHAVNPARKPDVLAAVVDSQLATGVGAVGVHQILAKTGKRALQHMQAAICQAEPLSAISG